MSQSRINFVEKGEGPPLVLVHGFPTDGRMWHGVGVELTSAYRVLIPDLPGFGRSASAVPFTIDSLADDLFEQLNALAAIPCILAGYSMGGYVALSFASRHSEALRGLVLVDTRAEADSPQGREAREQMIRIVRASGSVPIADQMLPKMLSPETLANRPQIVAASRKIMESCSPQAIEYALTAMRDRADRTNDLSSISVPTLIIVGEADSITPPATAEGMSQRIRGSAVRVIPGAGHMSPMEQPAEVGCVIRDWLRRGMGVPPMQATRE